MLRLKDKIVPILQSDVSIVRPTKSAGALDDRLKNRFDTVRWGRNHTEYLGRRLELFERLVALACDHPQIIRLLALGARYAAA